MTKLSIAVLAGLALASFGCGKKGGHEAVAKMIDFKDRMCQCRDKACADKLTDEMSKWSQDQAKSGNKEAKVSDDDTKKLAAVTDEMTKCMTKALAADAANPPMANPPAGSAAAPPPPPPPPSSAESAPPAGSAARSP